MISVVSVSSALIVIYPPILTPPIDAGDAGVDGGVAAEAGAP